MAVVDTGNNMEIWKKQTVGSWNTDLPTGG